MFFTNLCLLQGRGSQGVDSISHGKAYQLKMALSSSNGLSTYGSSIHGRATVEKIKSKFQNGSLSNDVNGGPDALNEQNRGPRINKSRNHMAVKAYTTRAGESDAQGNIVVYTDEYNRDDFPLDYLHAKFFVIKSYSEDDVHKSIKYNVWSSTPNGNKKLQCIYEDAQRIAAGNPRGCPVFLFFSVSCGRLFFVFLAELLLSSKLCFPCICFVFTITQLSNLAICFVILNAG